MSRISLGYFIIAGLVLWGLPGVIVAGPQAILYTVVAVLPIWWICLREKHLPVESARHLSTATCAVLAIFSLTYLIWDALFGRNMLQYNLFLFRGVALDRVVDRLNTGISQGGGVADLLGNILSLLPFALIDATRNTSRYGRWILWTIAILYLFYGTSTGRGPVLLAVLAIVLGRTSDWRRILAAVAMALAAFAVASSFRGDTAGTQSALFSGIVWPFINLGLMLNTHCGNGTWYGFIAEFLKKFLPAFLIPKTIFSFNMEMSMCIYPSADSTVTSVSVFTWLGEILYYKPSWLTALVAGGILGILARAVDRRFVESQMYSSRLFVGLLYINLARSRTQDIFSFLIAQLIFLLLVFPCLRNLTRTLRRFLLPANEVRMEPEAGREPL